MYPLQHAGPPTHPGALSTLQLPASLLWLPLQGRVRGHLARPAGRGADSDVDVDILPPTGAA